MDVIVCLDDRRGMLFHGRRQSRDRRVIADILARLGDRRLRIGPCSAELFAGQTGAAAVSGRFLEEAGAEDVCFVEDQALAPWQDQIGRLTIYWWNRHYPSDRKLDLRLEEGWQLCSREEFPGYSHQTITREVYQRCGE